MTRSRRRQPIFLTWPLYGSLPPKVAKSFIAMDRLLDEARTGPSYLSLPEIAAITLDSLNFNSNTLGHFELHAYVIMPNHLHLLATPAVSLPKLTKSLREITSKRAGAILHLRGTPFWQSESHHHPVSSAHFEKVKAYIEQNPVRAGLSTGPRRFPLGRAPRTRQPRPKIHRASMLP